LLRAQRQLGQALTLQPHDSDLLKEQNALQQVVQKHVQEKLENGKYLYSMGEVDAAIAAWQVAAALAPQDQALQQRLERAQKFRQRYEELKK
jgi:tetratricopeptide (TPR) repeat protein